MDKIVGSSQLGVEDKGKVVQVSIGNFEDWQMCQ